MEIGIDYLFPAQESVRGRCALCNTDVKGMWRSANIGDVYLCGGVTRVIFDTQVLDATECRG